MGDPRGIGGFMRGKPNIKQIVKKNQSKLKNRRNRKKIGKIGYFFLLKMVKNALGTHETPLKVNNLSKKT